MANGIDSPLRKTWRRLLKNKPAVFSLILILIAIVLAILGPSIAPDKTPNADDQVLELANVNPGFKMKMLLVQKNREEKSPSFLNRIVFGRDNPNQLVPIVSYSFDDSANIVIQAYVGEGRTPELRKLPLVDVEYALSNEKPQIHINGDRAAFTAYDETHRTASLSALRKDIQQNRIVTKSYHLGTDNYGRDILSRLLFGVRVSLSVGLIAVLISLTIGIFMGSVAGFFRDDTLKGTLPSILAAFAAVFLALFSYYLIFKNFNFFFFSFPESSSAFIEFLLTILILISDAAIIVLYISIFLIIPIFLFYILRFVLKNALSFFKKQYSLPVDSVIMWFINVIWAIPTILLAMAIRFAIGDKVNSFLAIFIAVGLSMWVEVARIVRGQVLSLREMEYIQAARGLGYHNPRIIMRHILPNIIGPIMVIAASDFASAILIEAGLSFVGIGVKPPTPSWGTMLSDHRAYLSNPDKAFLALAPGICIMVMVLAFNLFGNGLRDAFDVKGSTIET